MEEFSTETLVENVHEWACERMNELEQERKYLDLVALYEEYQEWMTKDDDEDVEVMSITKIDLDDDESYGWYD